MKVSSAIDLTYHAQRPGSVSDTVVEWGWGQDGKLGGMN